jgi:hypothetical protein
MNKLNRSIPLAFLLAMASDTSAAPLGGTNDVAPLLTHGMLAEMLADSARPPVTQADGGGSPNTRIAQSFRNQGFINCFNGGFRNC